MLGEALVVAAILQSDARDLCLQARALQATAQAIRGDALLLKARAQEVRGARRLFGANDIDTALIASLITDAALCERCIARKTGIAGADVEAWLRAVARLMVVTSTIAECGACLTRTVAHRLG